MPTAADVLKAALPTTALPSFPAQSYFPLASSAQEWAPSIDVDLDAPRGITDSIADAESPIPSSGPRAITPAPPPRPNLRTPSPRPVAVREETALDPDAEVSHAAAAWAQAYVDARLAASAAGRRRSRARDAEGKEAQDAEACRSGREEGARSDAERAVRRYGSTDLPSAFLPRTAPKRRRIRKAIYWVLFAICGVGFAVWARWSRQKTAVTEDALLPTVATVASAVDAPVSDASRASRPS